MNIMKRFFTFILVVVLLLPVMASAQLTLEECQRLAREHYPEVAQYELITQSAEYNISNAARSWIPQVTLSGMATWQNEVARFPEQLTQMMQTMGVDIPGIAQDQYRVALDVNQTLWDGGASKANRQLAEAKANEARLTNDVSLYTLEERVNNLFFGILLLDENYAIALERKVLLDENHKRVASMQRNGTALQSDLDQVRVEQLTIQQQLDQNRASRQSFAAMLAMMIGQKVDSLTMPEEVISGQLTEVGGRPELQLIDARIATVETQKSLMQSQLMPKVGFFAQGYYGNPGLDMFKSMTSRDWTWNLILGLRMQWNISTFFTHKSDLQNLETQRRMLGVQRETFVFNNNLQASRQSAEVERMRRALESDDEIVSLRSSIRRTAESQHANGVVSTTVLLQRIAEESTARTTRSIHHIEMLKTIYELKHTSGELRIEN